MFRHATRALSVVAEIVDEMLVGDPDEVETCSHERPRHERRAGQVPPAPGICTTPLVVETACARRGAS